MIDQNEKNNKSVSLRLDSATYERMKIAAKNEFLSVSGFVRKAIDKALRESEEK